MTQLTQRTQRELQFLKSLWIGQTIEMVELKSYNIVDEPIPQGSIGEVYDVSNTGLLFCKWNNGSYLPISINKDDFKVIKGGSNNEI